MHDCRGDLVDFAVPGVVRPLPPDPPCRELFRAWMDELLPLLRVDLIDPVLPDVLGNLPRRPGPGAQSGQDVLHWIDCNVVKRDDLPTRRADFPDP